MTNEKKYRWGIDSKIGGNDKYGSSFSIEESNRMIKGYIKNIKECGKAKKIKIKYKISMDEQEESRISEVEIKSLDGLIEGEIYYRPSRYDSYAPLGVTSASVCASIYFNSNNKKDIKKRDELLKIFNRKN